MAVCSLPKRKQTIQRQLCQPVGWTEISRSRVDGFRTDGAADTYGKRCADQQKAYQVGRPGVRPIGARENLFIKNQGHASQNQKANGQYGNQMKFLNQYFMNVVVMKILNHFNIESGAEFEEEEKIGYTDKQHQRGNGTGQDGHE